MRVLCYMVTALPRRPSPVAQDGKESTCNAGALVLIPVLGRSPGEGNAPIFSSGELHGQRSLAGYSPWDSKELDMNERLSLLRKHNCVRWLWLLIKAYCKL